MRHRSAATGSGPDFDELPLLATTDPVLRVPPGAQSGHKMIPQRWYYVLSLHLSGYTAEAISDLTGYNTSYISVLLKKDRVLALRQQMLSSLDDEFQALYSSVVSVIRNGLLDNDPKVRLEAAEKWMKAHGKYKHDGEKKELSAEDVVNNILQNYGTINVQVNNV
jgi:hypothetical protein